MNNHRLELIVNGVNVDLFSEGINLRINKIISDPTKLITTQSEYSFSFNLPITPLNTKIFNYINASSKRNKFSGRYNTIVYADNIKIFEGTLKIASIEDNMFKCNLYQNKVNTIETIFGETTMNEIDWYVPFKGIDTVNEVNANTDSKYFFPLVAYSLFNKVPSITTESGYRKYTDKYIIDETNKFYYNSFVPSLNLIELLKKCCELKGYQLQGDILADKVLNNIYLSNYIADEQDPLYNYGDADMGEVSFDFNFKNYTDSNSFPTTYVEYTLSYPPDTYENYSTAFVYNLLSDNKSTISNIHNESKMLVNGGVQIPADGWYEITLDANFGISSSQSAMTAYICTGYERNSKNGNAPKVYENVSLEVNSSNMPTEIQLLRYNTSDGDVDNLSHDIIYKGAYPNEYVADAVKRTAIRESTSSDRVASRGGASTSNYRNDSGNRRTSTSGSYRYSSTKTYTNVTSTTTVENVTTAVDTYNNPNFICGMAQSSYANTIGYIKNGYSWNYSDGSHTDALYNCNGYYYYDRDAKTYIHTDVNQNILNGTTESKLSISGRKANGTARIIIKLNKNDMLVPFIQQQGFYNESDKQVNYKIEASGSLKVRAIADITTTTSKISYNMNSLFDKNLNLGNFNNKEQKISDFFNDIIKTFNLNASQNGNSIVINKNQISDNNTAPIDLDNKTNTSDAIFEELNVPRSIEVKYKIDTEEEGFYRSVEDNTNEEQMQSNNWKDYGDYGYSKVTLSNADDSTDLSQSINFSFNWNRPFKVLDFEQYDATETEPTMQYTDIQIPVIGKTEWWIENYDYEGNAQNDGRGLTQRMWFRNEPTDIKIPLANNYTEEQEWYYITTPSNNKLIDNNTVDLSFKNKNNTLLTKFFNTHVNGQSDNVEIEVYLNPMEYKAISNGASVHFDDDIYQPLEINGYDPSGINPTKLKLMKR